MSLSAAHQTHMNVVDSRTVARKALSHKGTRVYVNGNYLPKNRVLSMLKAGYLDNYKVYISKDSVLPGMVSRGDYENAVFYIMPESAWFDSYNYHFITLI